MTVDDHGQTEVGESIRRGELPRLDAVRSKTAQHTAQVQDTLAEID